MSGYFAMRADKGMTWEELAGSLIKAADEATRCSECEKLYTDGAALRCRLYDDAIIRDTNNKHCEDSIK